MKYVPNVLSFVRILLSAALIFTKTFSMMFVILYVVAGFTDMIDGAIARKFNACSEFGSRLDSVGDFIFVAVCIPKFFCALEIPFWTWICIFVIAFIKISNLVFSRIKYQKFLMLHTIPNKITGFVLFLFPLILLFIDIKFAAIPVCALAFFAALHEGFVLQKR